MEENIIRLIEKSGLKKAYIAKQIDVSNSMFSMILRGDRSLTPEKEAKLKSLLNKAVA